ncbi:hypothetical protein [Lactobacillus johnsonii]|uniref:hypothetical protein n=1 Tax=Lactobacillus johnsonii TaxID=33959 RepID=UPI003CFEA940
MRKKFTLNEFIIAELKKYKIEDTPQNRKNLRNKFNYLIKTNYHFAKLWSQSDTQSKGYHSKILTSELCKALDLYAKEYLQKYAVTHMSKEETEALAIIDNEENHFIDQLNLIDKLKNKGYQSSLIQPSKLDEVYIMLKILLQKEFPDTELNLDQITEDLTLKNQNDLTLAKEDKEALRIHQAHPDKYYLKKIGH